MNKMQRLLAKTHIPEGCWTWTGATNPGGYGKLRTGPRGGSRVEPAHRAMWEAVHGPIIGPLSVLHTCDNPPCVRPSHLYLGTAADNARDRAVRARARAKLTESQVRVIRTAFDSGLYNITALAQDFDVSPATVHAIVHRHAWRHVT